MILKYESGKRRGWPLKAENADWRAAPSKRMCVKLLKCLVFLSMRSQMLLGGGRKTSCCRRVKSVTRIKKVYYEAGRPCDFFAKLKNIGVFFNVFQSELKDCVPVPPKITFCHLFKAGGFKGSKLARKPQLN